MVKDITALFCKFCYKLSNTLHNNFSKSPANSPYIRRDCRKQFESELGIFLFWLIMEKTNLLRIRIDFEKTNYKKPNITVPEGSQQYKRELNDFLTKFVKLLITQFDKFYDNLCERGEEEGIELAKKQKNNLYGLFFTTGLSQILSILYWSGKMTQDKYNMEEIYLKTLAGIDLTNLVDTLFRLPKFVAIQSFTIHGFSNIKLSEEITELKSQYIEVLPFAETGKKFNRRKYNGDIFNQANKYYLKENGKIKHGYKGALYHILKQDEKYKGIDFMSDEFDKMTNAYTKWRKENR